MGDIIAQYLNVIVFLVLLACGYFFGKIAEKKHYQSIIEREKHFINLPTTSSKKPIGPASVKKAELVSGSIVVSVDYFKRFLASLRNIFGGKIQAYETLLDRARREAVLRLKESCPQADQIINLRIETTSISKGQKNQIGSVEVLAYATAVYFDKSPK